MIRFRLCLFSVSCVLLGACSSDEAGGAAVGGGGSRSAGGGQDPQRARWFEGDWRTTPTGLSYRVLAPGADEDRPADQDRVTMKYSIYLTDGRLVTTSTLGAPQDGSVGGLPMPGWTEAVRMMTPGAHYLLRIPPALAYGVAGNPPKIPANSTILLDVRLASIKRIPVFRRLRAEHLQLGHKGLLFDVEVQGEGPPPRPRDIVRFNLTFWNHEKVLIESTHYVDEPYKGRVFEMNPVCVRDALRIMRPGTTALFRVPNVVFANHRDRPPLLAEGQPSFWLLELISVVRPRPAPDFVMPGVAETSETPSGLRYQVLAEGSGDRPETGDKVLVHYSGWLEDGTFFDGSYSKGEPATFGMGEVIGGWREGLRLMAPGSAYRFVIPPDLAYGDPGKPPTIPPGATLVFYVEMVEVVR